MACAVGNAVLNVIDEEKLQENCENVGTYLLNELAKLRDEFEILKAEKKKHNASQQ